MAYTLRAYISTIGLSARSMGLSVGLTSQPGLYEIKPKVLLSTAVLMWENQGT